MLLLNLANRGLNLWCVESNLLGLTSGQPVYSLTDGSIDLLNVVYCQPTRQTGTDTVAATSVTTDLAVAQSIRRIGVKFSAITASETVTFASSSDDITYTTLKAVTKTDWATGEWYWFDLPAITSAQYFRVSTAGNITVTEFYLASAVADLPVVQWNRDTWSQINNKAQIGRPSTNYYLERVLTPQITLWPIPNNNYDHIQVFVQRQVQDIGSLQQDIEIPQRWVESITWQLAVRLAYELPSVPPEIIPLVTQMADKVLIEVERDESDGAPIAIQPGISVYTR
jgi:hypothetical protein